MTTKKVYKTIRKWAKLRSLDYKVCKRMYERLSDFEKNQMEYEMTTYINAVRQGVITPSKPVVRKESQPTYKIS